MKNMKRFYLGFAVALIMVLAFAFPAMAAEDNEADTTAQTVIAEESEPVLTFVKKSGTWYYCKDGETYTDFTGFARNTDSGKWWYVEKGVVNRKKTGLVQDKIGVDGLGSSKGDWWNVVKGQVDFRTTLAKNTSSGNWWYVKNGKVDKSFTGVAKNADSGKKWYVQNGRVTMKARGIKTVSGTKYAVKKSRVVGTLKKENGKYYWYKSGKKVTGWVSLSGYYYYFDRSTGALKMGGSEDGIKLNSHGRALASAGDKAMIKTMIKARKVYLSVTKTSDSKSTQLKKCFDWVLKHPYKRYRRLPEEKDKHPRTWVCTFANDEFNKGKGCCVSEACALAFLANECGYTAYVCDDTGHAWVEINGKVYDTLFAEAKSYNKYYGSSYSTAGLHRANKTKIK